MKTPEPEYPQLPEDMVRGKAPRPARRDLVSPPQKVPRPVIDVVVDRPIGRVPCAVAEVARPPAQHAVELGDDDVPRRLVARTKDLPDASLDPLDRLLRRCGSQIPVTVLPVTHRPKGVPQKGKRLAPPIDQPGLLLIERQAHLGEPPTTLREHLRRPVATQDHEVVRVVHEPCPVPPVEPPQTEDLQVAVHVEVREQRRDHPALRRAPRRPLAPAVPPPSTARCLCHGRLEPHLEQPEHPPIADASRQRLHQLRMRDRVEGNGHTLPISTVSRQALRSPVNTIRLKAGPSSCWAGRIEAISCVWCSCCRTAVARSSQPHGPTSSPQVA